MEIFYNLNPKPKPAKFKKFLVVLRILFCGLVVFAAWQAYIPKSWGSHQEITYVVKKGSSEELIARDLQKEGVIGNDWFFVFAVFISGNHGKLQAGDYSLSPSMPVAQIIKKMATGDVIKNDITIIAGWDLLDIGTYLQNKNIISSAEFLAAAKNSPSTFSFLSDKPKKADLEGYLFPDTYNLPKNAAAQTIINLALVNFDKKLTPALRREIAKQHKTIFQIVTMASILEKEVKTPGDKKIVAGILWKRIAGGVPLQVDATIDYATGKTTVDAKDLAINSPYNTYKYYGLPPGPICNPGMDSILAAIYPTTSDYWYYLSDPKTGKTIFSATLQQQAAAIKKYLN